jgi:hypothetical protein
MKKEQSTRERLKEYEERASSLRQLAEIWDRQAEQAREKLERQQDEKDET